MGMVSSMVLLNVIIALSPCCRVDFFIPGVELFTGFSMTSAPSKLRQDLTFDLAVQKSDYPPTLWVHTEVEYSATCLQFDIFSNLDL